MRVAAMAGVLAAAVAVGTGAAAAETQSPATPTVKREIIPGSELMTSQEREQYRQRIRAARTPQEEEQVRAGHIRQMRERARLHGLTLPEAGVQK